MTEDRSRLPVLKLLLEAVAIFAGVTLGFLADDYRDHRNARDQEQEALRQVLQDLRIDVEDMTPLRRQAQAIARQARLIGNELADGSSATDLLVTALDSLSQTPAAGYEPSAVAFTGLRSTGRIDLVRDEELRRALVTYFEDQQPIVQVVGAMWQQVYWEWWDRFGPYVDFFPSERESEGWPNVRGVDAEILRDRILRFETLKLDDWSRIFVEDIDEALALNETLSDRIASYLTAS